LSEFSVPFPVFQKINPYKHTAKKSAPRKAHFNNTI